MFVTVNVSFNAYACHEVHFVAKFIWSRTYVPKSSRHEVTFHLFNVNLMTRLLEISPKEIYNHSAITSPYAYITPIHPFRLPLMKKRENSLGNITFKLETSDIT